MRDRGAGGNSGRQAARRAAQAEQGRRIATAMSRHSSLPVTTGRMDSDFFRNVWKATGLRGKPPPVYSGGLQGPGALGQQPWYSRQVHLHPEVARDLRAYGVPGARRNMQALEILLHEYAHVPQPTALRRSVVEGGAQAWTKQNLPRVLRSLGGPRPGDIPTRFPAYQRETRQMQRHPVTRDFGQFGRRP